MEWVFILSCVLGLLVFLAILQQVWLAYQGRGIRGPGLVPPFVGNIVAMIMTPWNFYIQQEKLGKLSWNSFLGLYVPLFVHAVLCVCVSDQLPLEFTTVAYARPHG